MRAVPGMIQNWSDSAVRGQEIFNKRGPRSYNLARTAVRGHDILKKRGLAVARSRDLAGTLSLLGSSNYPRE